AYQLERAVVDIESWVRGELLEPGPTHFGPYRRATDVIDADGAELERLAEPDDQPRVAMIRTELTDYLDYTGSLTHQRAPTPAARAAPPRGRARRGPPAAGAPPGPGGRPPRGGGGRRPPPAAPAPRRCAAGWSCSAPPAWRSPRCSSPCSASCSSASSSCPCG